jgi:hypothetical protein
LVNTRHYESHRGIFEIYINILGLHKELNETEQENNIPEEVKSETIRDNTNATLINIEDHGVEQQDLRRKNTVKTYYGEESKDFNVNDNDDYIEPNSVNLTRLQKRAIFNDMKKKSNDNNISKKIEEIKEKKEINFHDLENDENDENDEDNDIFGLIENALAVDNTEIIATPIITKQKVPNSEYYAGMHKSETEFKDPKAIP